MGGWVFLGCGQERRVFIGRGIDRGYSQRVVGDGGDDGRCSLRSICAAGRLGDGHRHSGVLETWLRG